MRLGRGKAHPPAIDERLIGGAKPLRHPHHAIVPARADRVANPVERREFALGQRRRALEHGLDDVGLGRAIDLGNAHHRVEDMALVADGGGEAHG